MNIKTPARKAMSIAEACMVAALVWEEQEAEYRVRRTQVDEACKKAGKELTVREMIEREG